MLELGQGRVELDVGELDAPRQCPFEVPEPVEKGGETRAPHDRGIIATMLASPHDSQIATCDSFSFPATTVGDSLVHGDGHGLRPAGRLSIPRVSCGMNRQADSAARSEDHLVRPLAPPTAPAGLDAAAPAA